MSIAMSISPWHTFVRVCMRACMCVSQTGVGPVSHKAIKGRVSSGMCDGAGQRAGGAVACVFVCSVRVINKRKRRGTNNVLLLGPGLDPFSTFTRPPPPPGIYK